MSEKRGIKIRKFEAEFKKSLTRESGAKWVLFAEKR
jgi:hypothetical protein